MNSSLQSLSRSARSFHGGWKPLEITLAILKPEAFKHPYVRETIHEELLHDNFYFVKTKTHVLSLTEAETFYSIHKDRFFYNRLVTFMSSGPIFIHILARDDAILRWRQLLGPTKTYRAQYEAPLSIRGKFGLSDTRNVAHGSDSITSAIEESKFFFPEFDYSTWISTEGDQFRENRLVFDSEMLQHKIKHQ